MAKTVVTALEDWRKISELSGGDPRIIMHEPATDELECPDVTQPALDAGHTAYMADQVNIDAATQAAKDAVSQDSEKEVYDIKRVLRAMVELMIDEFNILRTIEGLPDRTLPQARSAIRNTIDNL